MARMNSGTRLTTSTDEASFAEIFGGGESVFVIPFFQRAYKWRSKQLDALNQDVLGLLDERADAHFLGAIIMHGHRTKPSETAIYELIDGQQRITTLYLYVCAFVKFLCEKNRHGDALTFLRK